MRYTVWGGIACHDRELQCQDCQAYQKWIAATFVITAQMIAAHSVIVRNEPSPNAGARVSNSKRKGEPAAVELPTTPQSQDSDTAEQGHEERKATSHALLEPATVESPAQVELSQELTQAASPAPAAAEEPIAEVPKESSQPRGADKAVITVPSTATPIVSTGGEEEEDEEEVSSSVEKAMRDSAPEHERMQAAAATSPDPEASATDAATDLKLGATTEAAGERKGARGHSQLHLSCALSCCLEVLRQVVQGMPAAFEHKSCSGLQSIAAQLLSQTQRQLQQLRESKQESPPRAALFQLLKEQHKRLGLKEKEEKCPVPGTNLDLLTVLKCMVASETGSGKTCAPFRITTRLICKRKECKAAGHEEEYGVITVGPAVRANAAASIQAVVEATLLREQTCTCSSKQQRAVAGSGRLMLLDFSSGVESPKQLAQAPVAHLGERRCTSHLHTCIIRQRASPVTMCASCLRPGSGTCSTTCTSS